MGDESENAARPASAPGESNPVAAETPSKGLRQKATAEDVLRFVKEVELINANSLMEKFGYTWRGAYMMIQRLRHKGQIERYMKAGDYCITEAGLRRISDDKA